jgi:pilus assembly protein CpaE
LREAISGSARLNLTIVPHRIEPALHAFDPASARVIIADIDARDRAELLALQALMMKISGRIPVVVLTQAFDDAVARWLIQIRVADFLRKPVEPVELLKSCVKAVQLLAAPAEETPASADASQIVTFVPAMGGVGATSLAIETALQMMRAGPGKQGRTCIVDLDLQAGSCAEYLDLEARLDLSEIGPHPERIDYQLLDVMFSRG